MRDQIKPEVAALFAEIQAVAIKMPMRIADVAVALEPHISGLVIRVFLGGWVAYAEAQFSTTIYGDWENAEEECWKALLYLEGLRSKYIS